MKIKPILLTTMTAMLLLSGCAAKEAQPAQNTTGHNNNEHTTTPAPAPQAPQLLPNQVRLANGDIQETAASVQEMPKFLADKHSTIVEVYALAGQNLDILKYMPCYCGCGESAGHMNNMQCFVNEVKDDGTIVWDDHGTRCGTCMDIAVKSVQLHTEGKTLKEIRTAIDAEYKQGYAKPTPTPMPF